MARGRSRTPAKKAAASPKKAAAPKKDEAVFNKPFVQSAITIGIISVFTYLSEGGISGPSSFLSFLSNVSTDNVSVFGLFSFNFVVLGHQLNSIGIAGNSGYWLQNFAQCVLEAFTAPVVYAVFNGASLLDAVFSGQDILGFFILWYFVKQDFFGVWSRVQEFGGDAFSNILGICTDVFTTNHIILASGGTDLLRGVAAGTIAGTASNFFPLNKGITFKRSHDGDHAFAVAIFIAGNGFALVDTVVYGIASYVPALSSAVTAYYPDVGGLVNDFILSVLYLDAAKFVLTVTFVNQLWGEFFVSFTGKLKPGFDCFNLAEKVATLVRL